MKLLDPLNGMKFSQMHFFVHIAFFIVMFFVDNHYDPKIYDIAGLSKHHTAHDAHAADAHTEHHALSLHDTPIQDMTISELREEVAIKKDLLRKLQKRNFEEEQERDESRFKTNWDVLQSLSGHGSGGAHHASAELTPKEEYQQEKYIFHMLQWTHLAIFLNQMFIAFLKKRGYHDFAQVLGACQLAFGQFPFFYNIYFCKTRLNTWEHGGHGHWNEMRIFMFLEIIWFFQWIFVGIGFLAFAYLFKLSPISKEESVQEADDNPWNDKFSDDFMRYEKAEMYNFSHTVCKLLFDIMIAFSDQYNIGRIGERSMYPTRTLFGILIVDRLLFACIFLYALYYSLHITTYSFKRLYRIYLVVHVIVIASVVSIYFAENQLKGQSLLVIVWVRVIFAEMLFDGFQHIKWMYDIGMCNCGKARTEAEELAQFTRENSLRNESDMVVNQSRKEEIIHDIKKKEHMDFEEDFTTMTVFSFLVQNEKKFWLTDAKRAQMFHQALAIQANTLAMLVIVFYAIWTNEDNRFTPMYAHNFPLFYVKIACVLALHFVIYPEVSKGLNIMKLANQHPGKFVKGGDKISYILGLIQVMLAIICEILNLFMLTFQHTIAHCIIHFVAFEVIIDLSNMYFESLMNNRLKHVVHHPPKFSEEDTGPNKKARPFKEKTCFHKMARIIYKILRCMFVSVNYYFAPYVVIYWQFVVKVDSSAGHAAGGHH